jgi:DNA-binding NtrC family response regulator
MIALKREGRVPEAPVILCVDDDPSILESLRRVFRGERCTVLTAQTPQRALEILDEENVGILMADQRMPGMYGSELLKEAQLRSPHTVRVLLTGYAGTSMVSGPLLEGVEFIVAKPWNDRVLRRTIRGLLEGIRRPEPLRSSA